MILYISGPMTGIKNFNHKKFFETERILRQLKHTVINPAKTPEGLAYESYMDISCAQVRACEGLVILNGFEKSLGARMELSLGLALSKRFYRINNGILEIFHYENNILFAIEKTN